MKKFFTAIAAIAVMAMFTSCEQDAPEINFSQTDTHTSDFSGIVAAINNQRISFEEKMDILQDAVDKGIIDYTTQFELLIAAIDNQTDDLAEKMQLINDVIDARVCNSCNGGIYSLPSDQSALYMQPAVWDAIKGKPEWEAAILSSLWEINITQIIPEKHDQGHVIAYIRTTAAPTFDLTWEWNNTAIQVGGVNQELVKVSKTLSSTSSVTTATYKLYKAEVCNLGFGVVEITDARGKTTEDFLGVYKGGPPYIWGPDNFVLVDVHFEFGGNTVTSATVTANMKE